MSNKYRVKIGNRTFASDCPFSLTRTITYSNGKKEVIKVTKKGVYRTMYDDDSPKRQKLPSYEYNDEKQTNYKQFMLPKQIANKDHQKQFLLNYFDLRGNNGTINFGS